jgi:nucleoside-triphosphatase THEP1
MPKDFDPLLAAVVFDHGIGVDNVLYEAIAALKHRGFRVGGAIQFISKRWTACRRVMMVEDLLTGETLKISQELGSQAQSCILNPAALAEASTMLRQAMNSHVDVVVGNRFGEQELNGRGLRAEFADAALAGFVVLTAVHSRHVDAWIEFGGGYATALQPSAQIVSDWAFNAVASRQAQAISSACDWHNSVRGCDNRIVVDTAAHKA